jgi:hypothetical protein
MCYAFLGVCVGLCSLTSACLLAGTIYNARKITQSHTNFRSGSLKIPFVVLHITLLVVQTGVVIFYALYFVIPSFSEDLFYKITSAMDVTIAVLDLFVIYVICTILDI